MPNVKDVALPLVEEDLVVTKQRVTTGRVRVSTATDLAEEIAQATLRSERIEVSHVPIGREVEAVPAVRQEGNVTIFPILEEILVVEKRLILREEVHIRRLTVTEDFEVPVTVRKQRAVIERLDAGEAEETFNEEAK